LKFEDFFLLLLRKIKLNYNMTQNYKHFTLKGRFTSRETTHDTL